MRSKHVQDDSREPFRDGVAELRQDDVVVGHLATQVERFWGLGGHQERVWLLITWSDGRRERIEEEYPPWTSIDELRAGFLRWSVDAQELEFKVVWLQSDEARLAWQRHGIHEPAGHYL
jgi:hypothetical protein